MSRIVGEVKRQVAAILESHRLRATEIDSGFRLRFASAVVVLSFEQIGAQVVIALRAPVLSDVSPSSEGVLAELNRRNCESHFGKWAYYASTEVIVVEYDLLGDHLQEDELMTAVAAIARLADEGDDALQQTLGTGRRAAE
jgi:antirestriction protein